MGLALSSLELRTVDVDALTADDERALVALVARTFPAEAAPGGPLHRRWTFDSRPRFVVLAHAGDALAGVRVVVERDVVVGGRALRIGGLGVGVAPEWQRRGTGTALTGRALEECAARGFDMALAFLFTSNSERLLRAHGFAPLRARVSYRDRVSGAVVVESAPAHARDVRDSGAVAHIEREGALDLGEGTW